MWHPWTSRYLAIVTSWPTCDFGTFPLDSCQGVPFLSNSLNGPYFQIHLKLPCPLLKLLKSCVCQTGMPLVVISCHVYLSLWMSWKSSSLYDTNNSITKTIHTLDDILIIFSWHLGYKLSFCSPFRQIMRYYYLNCILLGCPRVHVEDVQWYQAWKSEGQEWVQSVIPKVYESDNSNLDTTQWFKLIDIH